MSPSKDDRSRKLHHIIRANEQITGPPARHLISASGILNQDPRTVELLDNATGGGVLAFELLTAFRLEGQIHHQPRRLLAGDTDDAALEHIHLRCADENIDGIEPTLIDQQDTQLSPESFTHVFNNFGIFFADPNSTIRETYRILKPDGVVGFTSWKSVPWWSTVATPALRKFLPDAPELPDPMEIFAGTRWTEAKTIGQKLQKHGFIDVEAAPFRFAPNVPHAEFAEAIAFFVKTMASKTWDERTFATYANEIEPVILRYLSETWLGGKWEGEVTALVTIARKRENAG